MAAAPGIIRSSLNPNAPPFIPSSFQRVEDFSPEWWELVKSSTWFRDYWMDQHQDNVDGVSNAGEEDDIVALLPETFELEEFPDLVEDGAFFQPEQPKHLFSQNGGLKQEKLQLDIAESLGLKSPRGGSWEQRAKSWEKPPQTVSPRTPNRSRIIQQPR